MMLTRGDRRSFAGLWDLCFLFLAGAALSSGSAPAATLEVAWTAKIHSAVDSSAAVGADGTIYFGDFYGKLLALKPDGSQKWAFTTGHGGLMGVEIRSSPAIAADGSIYFGCRDNKFYALRPDGKKKWEFQTGAWVDSSPAIASDGAVCFGSWDQNFYMLDSKGAVRWRFHTGGAIDNSPAIDGDGAIYFGSHDKKFYALQPDGRKKWEFATGGQIASSPALWSARRRAPGDEHESGATALNRCVYFSSVDGWFYALNLDGSLRWRLHSGGSTQSSPVVGPDGTIYVGVNSALWAISAEGKKLWAHPTDSAVEAPPVVLADNSVLFVSRFGWLFNVASEQTRNWSMFLNAYGCASPAVAGSGVIYAHQNPDFIALRGSVPLAVSAWPRFRGNARNTGNASDSTTGAVSP